MQGGHCDTARSSRYIHNLVLNEEDLDPPTPAGALGDEAFPPTPVNDHSANTTPADSHILQVFLECEQKTKGRNCSACIAWQCSMLIIQ